MRYAKILIVITILAGLFGAWFLLKEPDAASAPLYSVAKLRRGELAAVVSATGTLSPVITVQVGSQVSGTIQHLYADFNDQVRKGQVIAQIDPAVFEAKLAEAQANLKSAEAARDKAWVAVLDTKRQLQREAELRTKKLVAESVLDAARFAHDAAVAEHKLKVAAIKQAEAARQLERVNLAYTTIYAPIDGVIISRDVDVGQTVAASLQAPTLFTIAHDLTRMQVEADVDESFIGTVAEQQPVVFTVFAYTSREFHGRVAQVRLQPKVEAGVVKYNCIIHVDNTDLALKPGMTATVSIEVQRQTNVFKVPNAALRYVPNWPAEPLARLRATLQAGQAIVWAIDDNALRPVTVTTGIIGENETEVSGDELQGNLVVAVPQRKKKAERRRRFGLRLF